MAHQPAAPPQYHQSHYYQPERSAAPADAPQLDVVSPSGVSLLQLCERVHFGMRHGNARIPPPWHVGLTTTNPSSIADLKLLPSERIERISDNRASNVVIINGRFPDSMEMRQKVIADLMTARERARVAGPIFTLRWVTMGDALVQVQVEFLETSDAAAVLEQLKSARYDAGHGPSANLRANPPSTILQVHDFGRLVSRSGEPVNSSELTAIFSLSPNDLTVVSSYEEHVKFVCFHRGTLLYALLGSPFQSGELQTALWQVGLFYHAAYCHREFVSRLTKGPQAQPIAMRNVDDDDEDEDQSDLALSLQDATASAAPDLFGLVGQTLPNNQRRVVMDDDDFVQSAPVALPPELANLIHQPSLDTFDPSAGLLSAPPIDAMAVAGWSDFGLVVAPVMMGHRGGVLERPATPDLATPEEEDLASRVSAAYTLEAVAEVLISAKIETLTLTAAGKRRIIDSLLTPQSRQALLFDHPVLGTLILNLKWYEDEKMHQAIAGHLPDMAGAERLSKFVVDLNGVNELAYSVLLSETPPQKVLSLLHTPFFSRNLIFLLRSLPAEGEAAEASRQHLTRLILGNVQRQLFSTISGCRFIEAAVQRGKVDREPLVQHALNKLSAPEFVNSGEATLPGHLISQLNGQLAICNAALGFDAALDSLIVRTTLLATHRPEVRKFLGGAITKVHNDAQMTIVADLASSNISDERLKAQLIQDFATRGGRMKSVIQQPIKVTIGVNLAPLPAWLVEASAAYPRRAPPFPAVSGSCTVGVSASNGLYFFKDASGNATYTHPFTGAEYAPTPQAYLWDRLLSSRDIAEMIYRSFPQAKVDRRTMDTWLDDQRIRHDVIDPAVVAALRIGYSNIPPAAAPAVTGTSGAAAPLPTQPEKKHRAENTISPLPPQQSSPTDMSLIPGAIATYPATGDPFPPLPEGWIVKTSSTNGYYYFVNGETSAYKHPVDNNMYPVAPQVFLQRGGVSLDDFARDFRLDIRRVRQWFSDQTARDPRIDSAVMEAYGVTYKDKKSSDKKDANKPSSGEQGDKKERKKKKETANTTVEPFRPSTA